MTEQQLLIDCLKRLNSLQLDYYLTGSMASNYWGIPRTTHDLDFVICIDRSAIKPLVSAFSDDYYIDEHAVAAAFSQPRQFNVIDTRSALKIDFWLPASSAFDQEMLRRRVHKSISNVPVWIATPEDVILHKLVWNQITPSDRQLRDAAGIFAVQGRGLDIEYLNRWATSLGLSGDLENILSGRIRPKST
jgi:hypothetical protein